MPSRMKAAPISADDLLQIVKDFPWAEWNKKLAPAVANIYRGVLVTQGESASEALGGSFDFTDPFVSKFATSYVGERITQLDDTTQQDVSDLVRNVLADNEDLSVFDLGGKIQDAVAETFDGYERWRADRIARSETAIAYNHANVLGWAQADVSEVEVQDGVGDDECQAANGQTWSLRDALEDPIAHPNCQRTFSPVVDSAGSEDQARRPLEQLAADVDAGDLGTACARRAAAIALRDDPDLAREAAVHVEADPDDDADA